MKTSFISALLPEQEQWVERTLRSLSLREKIGQTAQERLAMICDGNEERLRDYLSEYPLGSVFCGGEVIKGEGSNAETNLAWVRRCHQASRVPVLVAGDLEAGAGSAVQGMTTFPHLMALGAADDEGLAYEYGRFTALEGRAAGFTWTFSPVVDLLQNWLNPVVSNRALGDRPGQTSRLASAIIRGMQDHGLSACAKHFPGDGVDFRDQHLVTSINSLSREAWWINHGAVFRAVIEAGVHTIMPGHIALPWFEPIQARSRRPRPATVSRRLLTDLLRHELGFEGVVISDALEMAGFTGWAPYEKRIVEAFNAGNDIMLWPDKRYFEVMERAVEEGVVSIERLDDSVRRILRMKARLGLHLMQDDKDSKALSLTQGKVPVEIRTQAVCLSEGIALRSITLVRNQDQLLPLDRKTTRHVLLHFAVNPTSDRRTGAEKELVEQLKARQIELTILENGNCLDIWNLEKQGQRWDAYLVVFDLPIHHAKNTVRPIGSMGEVMWTLQNTDTIKPIVISLGTPFLLWDMPFLGTMVNAYSPSKGSIHALVRALFGEAPFTENSPVQCGGDWVPATLPGVATPANPSSAIRATHADLIASTDTPRLSREPVGRI